MHRLEGLLIALDNLDAVIELIRGSRDRDAARTGLMETFELTRDPGPGDPRPAPAAADRARGRRDPREHADLVERISELRELLGDEEHGPRADQGGAHRDLRALRRRAPHGDRAERGRHRHRGPDRRPADGHLDHALGLHQVAAAGHLPPAAPRRGRHHGDGPQGRRLHRAPVRLLDARLPAVLHEPRQGLPVEGLRAAGGRAARRRAATSATCCRCARASGCSPCSRRATSRRPST